MCIQSKVFSKFQHTSKIKFLAAKFLCQIHKVCQSSLFIGSQKLILLKNYVIFSVRWFEMKVKSNFLDKDSEILNQSWMKILI